MRGGAANADGRGVLGVCLQINVPVRLGIHKTLSTTKILRPIYSASAI